MKIRILTALGTAALLRAEGVPVTDVSDVTGFPAATAAAPRCCSSGT